VPPPRRLGARLGEHFARRWGVAWTPRRRLKNYGPCITNVKLCSLMLSNDDLSSRHKSKIGVQNI
jgi:hypothetical protein